MFLKIKKFYYKFKNYNKTKNFKKRKITDDDFFIYRTSFTIPCQFYNINFNSFNEFQSIYY